MVGRDGWWQGNTTLQSVMRAIEDGNGVPDGEPPTFDAAEALEGLSILDDSFLAVEQSLPAYKTPVWDGAQPRPIAESAECEQDEGLWRSLMQEQRHKYEYRIQKLAAEVQDLRQWVGGEYPQREEVPAATVAMTVAGVAKKKKPRGPPIERERWGQVHRILDAYFSEYNIQI